MDRIRTFFGAMPSETAMLAQHRSHEYAPLRDPAETPVFEEPHRMASAGPLLGGSDDDDEEDDLELGPAHEAPFNWLEYMIFALVGVAMLWAWNMFLAASPYFSSRLAASPNLQSISQSAIISVSTLTNLLVMYLLLNIQASASYPYRINAALLINVLVFALLTLSTFAFLDAPIGLYFAFLLANVAATAWASGLMQNGAFAFAASFGRPEYTQAIMTGQALSGVLPPVTQMLSVLLVPASDGGEESKRGRGPDPTADPGTAAFIYFLTAVLVSFFALVAFQPLIRRHDRLVEARVGGHDVMASSFHSVEEADRASRKVVGMLTLWHKLRYLAAAVFGCFAVAMFFPVFTARIVSVATPSSSSSLPPGSAGGEAGGMVSNPAFFIPLGFFAWNLGDLCGRIGSSLTPPSLRQMPRVLISVAVARIVFLPLYQLCNVDGRGAVVGSDAFYLLLVQVPFGLTNGWLGSSCMMGAGEWVEEGEREAAGGFMGFALVAGLTTGSLLSFAAAAG